MHNNLHIDYDLLVRLREGDEKAFVTVFRTFQRYLYVLAYRYLMSVELAEDAVQYVFMKLWENRTKIDAKKGIKNLLFTILKNFILNEMRHNNIILQKNYELAQMAGEMKGDHFIKQIQDKETRTALYKGIEKLAPQQQKICRLKIEDEMSNQEIADQLNISVATVKSHYTQAIKTLRTILNETIPAIIAFIVVFF